MKKIIFLVALSVILISGMAFAQEAEKEEMPMGMGMGMGRGMGGMGMGMGKMCPPMMETSQMVATGEGGVIVLAGNKLMKYDADLNLVKEAEIKAPAGPMGGKQCPMMGKTDQSDASVAAESKKQSA